MPDHAMLRPVPGPAGARLGESQDLDPAQDLADLRRGWGDSYRITWDNGWFRATHIISGHAVDADNATDLRKLILAAERNPVVPRPPDRRTDS